MRGWNGAALALAGVALLSALPLRDSASTPAMLLEIAGYGFGGAVPECMQPKVGFARGLGIPARDVTVTMGCTFHAAALRILFAALALIGRTIRSASWR